MRIHRVAKLFTFGVLLCAIGALLNACPDSDLDEGVQEQSIVINGRVLSDTGAAVQGAAVAASVVPGEAIATAQALQRTARVDMTVPAPDGQKPTIRSEPSPAFLPVARQVSTTTDASGVFSVTVQTDVLPVRVLVEVTYQAGAAPTIQSARWGDATGDALELGDIVIPAVENAEVTLQNGAGQNADGSIQVEGLPANVNSLFARAYDPDESSQAFPGEFREMGNIPLNSSLFLWMEALDADGNPVDDLSQAATIRSRIPVSQWGDLEDINAGTDRIEIPIYVFNEATNMWEQQAEVGWLEDAQRTVLPEDAQSVILDGTFAGEIFATFNVNHLSWMNVDYAYIGPWTLSRISRTNRNNDCLFQALQLAKTIAMSQAGRQAYAKVNQAGADIATELSDGNGPELKNSSDESLRTPEGNKVWGQYTGDSGGSETQFEMNNDIWNGCAEGATEDQKKNTILRMTVNILHETAHWKDDVKKYPKDADGNEPTPHDTPGEEGTQLERDLFGGNLDQDATGNPTIDGNLVDNATRDGWLNPANWPAPAASGNALPQTVQLRQELSLLDMTIFLSQNTFNLGDDILVTVTYENISASAIQVMNQVVLEGWPLYFNITHQATQERVSFLGPELELQLTDNSFTTLQPGETLSVTVNLVRDTNGNPQYQLIRSGTYEVTAVYEGFRGVPETISNALVITLNPGGSVSGVVTNATNGTALAGATVKVLQGDRVLATATTDAQGNYSFAELPPGTFALEAQAPGFLRNTQENITVVSGQTTTVNFSLSPLLTAGELRLVLTWGESPSDLDSHLWLPVDRPFHLFFGRQGNLQDCPFAQLDTDDTSSFGPETITISQRFPGTYTYAVFNFTGSPDITASEARVQVFDTSGLVATYNVPTEGTGRWWNVLSIDGETGSITEVNTIGDDPRPYDDSDLGCNVPQ